MASRVAGGLSASGGVRIPPMLRTPVRAALPQRRWQTRSAAAAIDPSLPRIYRYWIDVHGQLFLYDTVPKNLTSCFKSAQFLNFFFARVEPLSGRKKSEATSEPREDDDTAHWTEDPQELAKVMQAHDGSPPSEAGWEELWKRLRGEGLTWLSKCQGEWNVIHAVDTPVVFRTLSEHGVLTWGGDYTMPMDPTQLLVHPETGYLYHPSPYPPLSRWQRRAQEGVPSPYGRYSLISSYAVLQRLAQGLDIDPELHQSERRDDGRPCAGTVEWRGERHRLGLLDPEQDLAQS